MARLMLLHLAFVAGATLVGGVLGGVAGHEVGRLSPPFVRDLANAGPPPSLPPTFDPAEFGLGLGVVVGLFFGAGSGLFLVGLATVRDAWLARPELAKTLAARTRSRRPWILSGPALDVAVACRRTDEASARWPSRQRAGDGRPHLLDGDGRALEVPRALVSEPG